MSFDATSSSWATLADYYRSIGGRRPHMVAFIEAIAASRYANGIFGATSMHTLLISQTPSIALQQNVLRVEEWDDHDFVFECAEQPYVMKRWRKRCRHTDAFGAAG